MAKKKAVKRAVKPVKKAAPKAKRPVAKKTVKKQPSISQVPPDHAEQLHKLIAESHPELVTTELPVHQEPKLLTNEHQEAPADLSLTVKARKMVFMTVKHLELTLTEGEKEVAKQTTDASGNATFTNLKAGNYQLSATLNGKPKTKAVELRETTTVTFSI